MFKSTYVLLNMKEICITMKQSKISIDEETHKLLKVYCAQHGLLMSQFVIDLIRERIGDVDNKDCARDANKS